MQSVPGQFLRECKVGRVGITVTVVGDSPVLGVSDDLRGLCTENPNVYSFHTDTQKRGGAWGALPRHAVSIKHTVPPEIGR